MKQFVDREPLLFRKRAEIDPEFDEDNKLSASFELMACA